MHKRQTTLADIAKRLNISTATVSRALKDYPDISAATKKKVLELAAALNYRPNSMAAGLRQRESKIIGVIIPSIVNHFFSSVIKGIMQVAYEEKYRVMLCQSDESYEKEKADARALFSSQVDGVLVSIAHGTHDYQHFQEFQHAGIPIVFFDKVPGESFAASQVEVDDHAGAFSVVKHLIDQGCNRIAHFRGPLMASTSRHRFEGYLAAMKSHHLSVDESLIFDCEDISLEEGQAFALQACQRPDPADGIFCITDTVAMGAMVSLKQLGLRIPEQVAVAGFSDWEISTLIDPPLTSVAQPSLEMGKRAVRLLLKEIQTMKEESPVAHEHVVLHTQLKARNSSTRVNLQV